MSVNPYVLKATSKISQNVSYSRDTLLRLRDSLWNITNANVESEAGWNGGL